ncbi:NADPH dehydrogenase NamA [Tissierella sp.]|uniref:NADPH dehydrogenase NamA n=1 Tax=Tissierella sp. TaxID=41274 RepID=UPI002854DB82|nr:NADPH dehydrogenase NamA [Tissierella sp.]MDR7855451.1 NADPH dehydrogenase NamA [Tissierella sp.]
MKSLTEYKLKGLELKNRIVMPPMCMYSSDEDGMVKDFHEVHYISRAIGDVGLIIVEATGVLPNGRITSNDLGIWSDNHILGLKSLVDKAKVYGSKMAIQLAHAGRKCESNDEYIVAPSPIRFNEKYRVPRELNKDEIKEIVLAFRDAARRADEAGFDTIEIHGAHGYLIHEFLSPITNKRTDEYGGSLENRTRFLKEILGSIKEVWPKEKPILLRVSADDYSQDGINKEEMVRIINEVKENIDMVHVSTGGLISVKFPIFPGYQVTHSDTIRKECNIPTIAVGLIYEYDQIEEILNNNRADLVALGRALLRDPNIVLNMAYENDLDIIYPKQYERGYY